MWRNDEANPPLPTGANTFAGFLKAAFAINSFFTA
jgi:hypothetical protein